MVTYSQQKISGTNYSYFQLPLETDTIEFVIADTNLHIKKPVLLFCQGSQPIPLFLDFKEQGIIPVPLNNFNVNEINKYYHIAVISMPKTPLIVGKEHLNKRYNYVTDTSDQYSYSIAYQKADYADNYIRRANRVIEFLLQQKWVEPDKLIVAGHSQGSRIAVGLASSNKKITQLGLFGYNPNSRVDQAIRRARKEAEAGEITWEEADSIQNKEYDFYRLIHNEDSIKSSPGLISWKSFSVSTLDQLIHLNIPVYIAYGSNDIVADLCDLIPLYFIEQGKSNDLTLKRYPRLEHNFFPVLKNGQIDYQNGKWEEVMNEFINWTHH